VASVVVPLYDDEAVARTMAGRQMSTYPFSDAEKWGVFSVHGPNCYYNREPLSFLTMEVDHLIPESLARHPAKLAFALETLGLPDDFDLNSFENWLPICSPCNRTKSARIFEPTPLIQQRLRQAREGAERARRAATKVVTERELGDAIGVISRAASDARLKEHHFQAIVRSLLDADPLLARKVLEAGTGADSSIGLSRWLPTEDVILIAEVRLTPQLAIEFRPGRASLVHSAG
jgi:hypothetical protein